MIEKITLFILQSIADTTTIKPDLLASVANKLQDFANFETRPDLLEVKPDPYGYYSSSEMNSGLKNIITRCYSSGEFDLMIGITSVQFDLPENIISDDDNKISLISDYNWQMSKSSTDECCVDLRWLFAVIQLSVKHKINRQCINSNCMFNNPTELVLSKLRTFNICEECKEVLLSSNANIVDGLYSLWDWFIRNAPMFDSLVDLDKLSSLELRSLNKTVNSIAINDQFLNNWLYDKLGLRAEQNVDLSTLINNLYTSLGNKAMKLEWADDLLPVIENSRHIDTLLYLTRKRHRDHSRHQLNVANLGLFLMDAKVYDKSLEDHLLVALRNKYSKYGNIATSLDKSHILEAWKISALLHDTGYPLSHIFEIISNLCSSTNTADSVDFDLLIAVLEKVNIYSKRWIKLVEKFKKQIARSTTSYNRSRNQIFKELRDSFEFCFNTMGVFDNILKNKRNPNKEIVYDHGLWSAANLIRLLEDSGYMKSGQNITTDHIVIIEAIEAIALHNISPKDIKPAMEFNSNPLAMLLRLCDEIQEWNRGTLANGKFEEESGQIYLEPVRELLGTIYIGPELLVTFECPNVKKLEKIGWDMLKFISPKSDLPLSGFPINLSFQTKIPCE